MLESSQRKLVTCRQVGSVEASCSRGTCEADAAQVVVQMQSQAGAQRSDRVFAVLDQEPDGDVTTFLESSHQSLLITPLTRCTPVQ